MSKLVFIPLSPRFWKIEDLWELTAAAYTKSIL